MLNPYVIGAIAAAILASFIGGGLVGWHEKAIRVPALLEAQQTVDSEQCQKAQQLTKDENDELQKDSNAINAKLNSVRVQHPNTCVHIAGPSKLPASGTEHAGPNGGSISSDWLRSYAATAEEYRTEVEICTDFLQKERQTAPQN